jgi:hypothetical protein
MKQLLEENLSAILRTSVFPESLDMLTHMGHSDVNFIHLLVACCLNPQAGSDPGTQMVECSFREVGCVATVHPDELAAHLDTQIHYHTSVSIASKFHTISVFVVDLEPIFSTEFGGIIMIYLDTTFHIPGSNGSLD